MSKATGSSPSYPYVTNLDIKFGPLERMDVPSLAAACTERWYNQTLCRVNDAVVRLGVVQGEYHWHKHDSDDEFFYVVEGRFWIDLEDRVIELGPGQGVVVPKGRAPSASGSGADGHPHGRDGGDRPHGGLSWRARRERVGTQWQRKPGGN